MMVCICGYGVDENLAIEVPVPESRLMRAMEMAKVPETDPDVCNAYALSEEDARALSPVLHPGLTYFLEGYAS